MEITSILKNLDFSTFQLLVFVLRTRQLSAYDTFCRSLILWHPIGRSAVIQRLGALLPLAARFYLFPHQVDRDLLHSVTGKESTTDSFTLFARVCRVQKRFASKEMPKFLPIFIIERRPNVVALLDDRPETEVANAEVIVAMFILSCLGYPDEAAFPRLRNSRGCHSILIQIGAVRFPIEFYTFRAIEEPPSAKI
jgi:hypothetical protein